MIVERKDRVAHGAISITSIDLSLSLNCASFICTKTAITIYHFLHIATEILKLWINFFCLFCFVSSVFLSFSSKTYIRRLGLKLRKANWNIGRKWQRKVWVKLLLQFVRFFSFLLVLVTLLLFSVSFHPSNNYLQVSFQVILILMEWWIEFLSLFLRYWEYSEENGMQYWLFGGLCGSYCFLDFSSSGNSVIQSPRKKKKKWSFFFSKR